MASPKPAGRVATCPPYAFFLLHACAAWPVGVVGLAVASSLVKAGVSVHQTAGIIAATSLAFTFELIWAPMVDASLTRRRWFVVGAAAMCGCLAALLLAPWTAAAVPLMTALAFASSSGAAIAAVAVKGIMAYDVPPAGLGAASGFYTAGGTFAKAVGGAGTLWLLTHLVDRTVAAALSTGAAALAGTAILLALPRPPAPVRTLRAQVLGTLAELWAFLRTPNGVLIAVMCVIPFGAGTEAGLIGAIAREWAVTPDQLALFSVLGAATSVAGAILGGWISTRIGPWNAYLLFGWSMICVMVGFAFSPRVALYFMAVELCYRALANASYATLLSIVMRAIGRGAASTKAAVMWSLANLAFAYPTLIEGAVHDRVGTFAMLWTDAALGVTGFGVLMVAMRVLKPGIRTLTAAAEAGKAK
jgi:MFS transporter, PAT family, beta-lactamase induction signal transducer AmpG